MDLAAIFQTREKGSEESTFVFQMPHCWFCRTTLAMARNVNAFCMKANRASACGKTKATLCSAESYMQFKRGFYTPAPRDWPFRKASNVICHIFDSA